jgi:hypothetical protein
LDIKIKLIIHYPDAYVDYCPDYVILTINREFYNKIKEIRTIFEKYNFTKVQTKKDIFYKPIEFFSIYEEYDEELFNTISDSNLIIEKSGIYIAALTGDIEITSEYLDDKEVKQLIDFSELPIEHMPKYINDKDDNIRNIARERLENRE